MTRRSASCKTAGRLLRDTAVLATAAALTLYAAATSAIAPAPDNTPTPATATPPMAEVLISAPEPKYVAPTLRDRIGRIWAPVYINGQGPLRLVLDTGATTAAITQDVANLLGLDTDRARSVLLRGTTGAAQVPAVRARQMEIGDFLAENQRLVIVEDAFGGADGVLATRMLRDRRIHVEFRRDRIEITRSRNQPAPVGFATVPVRLISGHVPWVEAWVGPVRVKAVIDTGAQQTLGNLALRTALVAARRRGLDPRDEEVIGVTGDIQQGVSLAVPSIRLGSVTVRQARINFVDLYIFDHWRMLEEPALLIGMDVIGVLDTFILDYRRRELQLLTRAN
jgi:predicted aspartyl protease